MNRKLLLLDVALAAGVIYGGIQLRGQWNAAKAREASAKAYVMVPAPPPAVAPLPREGAVMATGYKEIAVKTLFDPSRNPDIPIEVPPPPPPPKEPPPFPSLHGMMDLGDPEGPIAIMSVNGASVEQEVHAGGMIGPFKLLAFSRREISLEWDGRVFNRAVSASAERAGGPSNAPQVGLIMPGVDPGPLPKSQLQELGPGVDLTPTDKACQAGDSTAAGTVVNGYRKELRDTPMGKQCHWSAVGR